VIFLDYNLPEMSGPEASAAIRALANASGRALIVATTAFSTPEKKAQCLAAGMTTFLGKPVTMDRLRAALAAPEPTEPTPASPVRTGPNDSLANLRLIVRCKGTSLAEELALYLSELDVELENLALALTDRNATGTGHYAHLLYGRSAFIAESMLEQTFRQIEAAAAAGHWDEAGDAFGRATVLVGELRVKFATAAPDAPPASDR
jgi:CheY-like chemotaxis protein